MKKGRKGKIAAMLLCGCVAVGLLIRYVAVQAIFDESTAVRYEEYAASHTIEESVLFIGTYLIHTQALTDELYEKAQESAEDTNQTSVYYKSELAGGAWYDITDAMGLADISGQGILVEESELADLWVTCYTGSDGITIDAVSGQSVSIFDTPDPYDLYNLPELEPIRLQYDNTYSADSEGIDKYYYNNIKAFFELDLRNDVTNTCDSQLSGLQKCYENLCADGEDELAEIVSKLMSKIDAVRRAEVFSQLSEIDDNELTKLQDNCTEEQYVEKDYDDEQYVENTSVTDAIGDSIQNCQESYIEHSGNMLSEGSTVLKNVEYEKSMSVVERAESEVDIELRALLLELKNLYHIQDGEIVDAEGELILLDDELIERAEEKYIGEISGGAGSTYQAAVERGLSATAKRQLLEDRKTEANAARSELQYMIQSKTDRTESEEAVTYTYGRIDRAEEFYGMTGEDDFKSKADETVAAHILWLQDLAASITAESDELTSEMDDLEAQKEELLTAQAQALDDNDLSAAKKYDALIGLVDEQIAAKEEELGAILSDSDSTAAEKAQAANAAGGSSSLNNINNIKNNALKDIADGNTDGLGSALDALAALGAGDALQDIRDALEGSDSASSSLLDAVDKAIADSQESGMNGDGSGAGGDGSGADGDRNGAGGDGSGAGGDGNGAGGDGNGSGTGALSADDLLALLESLFGDSFNNLGGDIKAAVTAALDRLGEDGYQVCADMSKTFLNQCLAENNPYVYQKLKGESAEHIPLKQVGICSRYRYVYNDTEREVTLTKKASVYTFVAYSDEVTLPDGSSEKLTGTVKVQGIPYTTEEDAMKYFDCQSEYIEATDYGVALNAKMEEYAEELISAVQEGVQ